MPMRAQRIDHRPVALDPGLALHEAVERLEEAQIVGDRAVEQRVDGIDEARLRRARRLGQRIDPGAPAIGHGLGDVGIAAAAQVGAQQGVAGIGVRPQRDVARGNRALVARRQDQVLAARPLVHAGGADILERGLPAVVDAAGDRALAGGRDLQDDRADILGVVEGQDVDRVGVGRQRLVLPGQRARPVDDLVELHPGAAHGLGQKLEVHRGHAPDDGLHRTARDGAARDLRGRLGLRGSPLRRRERCQGRKHECRQHSPGNVWPHGSLPRRTPPGQTCRCPSRLRRKSNTRCLRPKAASMASGCFVYPRSRSAPQTVLSGPFHGATPVRSRWTWCLCSSFVPLRAISAPVLCRDPHPAERRRGDRPPVPGPR